MVGVPGRSKGCFACRKRKVACSQERPACAICVKAGRDCPGYQRDRIFVYVDPRTKGPAISNRTSVNWPAKEADSSRNETAQTTPLDSVFSAANPSSSASEASSGANSIAIVSHPSLAATSYRQQLLGTFLSQFAVQLGKTSRKVVGQHWLSLVPEKPQLSPALDAAATAFCTAKLGRACADKNLLTESLKLYGRGLQELQRALWDPQLMYSDDTLGACVLLALYEVTECPSQSRKGYMSHTAGCARLVQMRGPQAHARGMGHSIFCSFRIMGCLESFVTKQTFLRDPAWMTVPFQEYPKTPYHSLLDLMLEAPALMKWGDTIGGLPTLAQQFATALALLQALWQLEERLRAFYAEFEVSMPGEVYWARTSAVEPFGAEDDDDDAELFPVHFAFPNTHVAGLLMLYWACMTMLYGGILPVHTLIQHFSGVVSADDLASARSTVQYPPLSTLGGISSEQEEEDRQELDPANLPPLDRARAFGVTGRKVCQSVAYCLDDEADDLGLFAVTAPMQMVRDVFEQWPGFEREVAWIVRMQARQARKGVSIAKFLAEAKGVNGKII